MTYGKLHRFLLRSVASRGVMTVAETELVLENYIGNENENEQISVQTLVQDINDKIRPFQQNIKITNDESTDEEVVIFLSLGYDEATKAQNVFSATELEYFRLLIERIMTTDARQLSGIYAINIVGQMKSSFTKTDAQKLLDTWCRMRYLDKDGDNYALGVRAIHEFEGYLRQNMPDTIEECCLCKQIVFRGFNCPACAKAVHTRCLNQYLEKIQTWPCCKADFDPDQLQALQAEAPINTNATTPNVSARQTTHAEPEEPLDSTAEEPKETSPKDSRLTQSQLILQSPTPEEAVAEPTVVLEETEEMDSMQEVIPEVSQRITRKRKRT
ncbi:nse1 non-SMC component of SMC5-6 complex domain-containing protein [Phthorimaea operculella]|nr:nse1 non-SMC component of SMC5-6 complex domain-containing protein [Phthorimaea operculella]